MAYSYRYYHQHFTHTRTCTHAHTHAHAQSYRSVLLANQCAAKEEPERGGGGVRARPELRTCYEAAPLAGQGENLQLALRLNFRKGLPGLPFGHARPGAQVGARGKERHVLTSPCGGAKDRR